MSTDCSEHEPRLPASGEAPVVFAPLFETGDARYAWLNRVVGVAAGRASGDSISFEVAEVAA